MMIKLFRSPHPVPHIRTEAENSFKESGGSSASQLLPAVSLGREPVALLLRPLNINLLQQRSGQVGGGCLRTAGGREEPAQALQSPQSSTQGPKRLQCDR